MTEALYAPTPLTRRAAIKNWQGAWRRRWTDASQTTRTWIQVGVLLGAVLIAYNYSLSTLLQTVDQQTPLAYISLVPVIALALAAVRARPLKPEPPIYDRQVDYTVGIPLVLAAVAINELLPARMSALFWFYRVDLFSLPIFVAGVVAIIFGCRVLWRQKLAIAFLFLAWPYPYEKYGLGVLNAFTNLTLAVMDKIAAWTHLATPAVSSDNALFSINHHGTTFALSIVSACSGVNSVVGFLLVGSAFAAIVRGPIVRRVLWLTGGITVLWALNIGRIAFIFFAGKEWGESVAINVFHPFIGLVLFALGVIVMLLLIRPLGMEIPIGATSPPASPGGTAAVPSLGPSAETQKRKVALAVPKVSLAVVAVVLAALVLGVSNVGLTTYDLVAGVAGEAKLTAFIQGPVAPAGWAAEYETTYAWAKPLFGDSSIWNRYIMRSEGSGPLHTNATVVADVINTPDLSSFSAYGVENCYTFHGYALADITQVSLVGGITGQAMSYTSQQYGSWSIVYWIVPVTMDAGSTSFERVVLYVKNAGQGVEVRGLTATASLHNIGGTLNASNEVDRALINNRTFLVAFADRLLYAQASHAAIVNAGSNGIST
ncbi:MAG: exosortase/archaeosortase family protein [Acidimicrobiales bacterium]